MGRKKLEVTEEEGLQVERMASLGINQDHIALVLGMSAKTLRDKFREQLDRGMAKGNLEVAQMAFDTARAGDTAMRIFLAKVRLGWKERAVTELDASEKVSGITVTVKRK